MPPLEGCPVGLHDLPGPALAEGVHLLAARVPVARGAAEVGHPLQRLPAQPDRAAVDDQIKQLRRELLVLRRRALLGSLIRREKP